MIIDRNQYVYVIDKKKFHCAMDVTMHFIGGKWKSVVLWYLRKDKKRFSELNNLIPQITEKMLSLQLKQLESDGLIKREVLTRKPPMKVEYSLTEFGKSLLPTLNEIAKWGRKTGDEKGKIVKLG